MITRYIYNNKRQLLGCVAALLEHDGTQVFGYSYCHPSDRRKLTKKLARRIAYGRLAKCEVVEEERYASGEFCKIFVKRRVRTGRYNGQVPDRIQKEIRSLVLEKEQRDEDTARQSAEEKGAVGPSVQVQ